MYDWLNDAANNAAEGAFSGLDPDIACYVTGAVTCAILVLLWWFS